jgi:hypothetical protein
MLGSEGSATSLNPPFRKPSFLIGGQPNPGIASAVCDPSNTTSSASIPNEVPAPDGPVLSVFTRLIPKSRAIVSLWNIVASNTQSSRPSPPTAGNGHFTEKDARRKLELPIAEERPFSLPDWQSTGINLRKKRDPN